MILGTLQKMFFPQNFASASEGGLCCLSTARGVELLSTLPLWGGFWDESVSHPYCPETDGAVINSAESHNSLCILVCKDGSWLVDTSSEFRKTLFIVLKMRLETKWGWRVLSGAQAWACRAVVVCFCSNGDKEWDFEILKGFLNRHIQIMKFLKAIKVIMGCDLKGNYRRWTLGLSFYFCIAFDAEELMHIAEEKICRC